MGLVWRGWVSGSGLVFLVSGSVLVLCLSLWAWVVLCSFVRVLVLFGGCF